MMDTMCKEAMTEEEKKDMAIKELEAKCHWLDEELEKMRRNLEIARLEGRIAGLEFSIRCNGVSGAEIPSEVIYGGRCN